MKKYIIEFTEEQLHLCANCIEDISRFSSGQMELSNTIEILLSECDDSCDKRDVIEHNLREIKGVIHPKLSKGASFSYDGHGAAFNSQRKIIGNTYSLYRQMRYFLTDKNNTINVYSTEGLPSGDIGKPKLIQIKDE